MPDRLTHLDSQGHALMVDVSAKDVTVREATARGRVTMRPETAALISARGLPKGDVLAVARVAGILAAKQTPNLIPLCHPLPIASVKLELEVHESGRVEIGATVRVTGRTGVEMEALTAVSVAALTVYDMCKAVDKEMVIDQVRLEHKVGGKSGEYVRPQER